MSQKVAQMLAAFSALVALITFGIGAVGTYFPIGGKVLGFALLGLTFLGFVAGVIALAQIRRFGKKGILFAGVIGLLLNGLFAAFMVAGLLSDHP